MIAFMRPFNIISFINFSIMTDLTHKPYHHYFSHELLYYYHIHDIFQHHLPDKTVKDSHLTPELLLVTTAAAVEITISTRH